MKKITIALTAILLSIANLNAQLSDKELAQQYLSTKGELTFNFQVDNVGQLDTLTNHLTIVHYNSTTRTVKAWANAQQFRYFESLNIPFTVPKNENEVKESVIYDVRPLASRSAESTLAFPLSTYPTYAEYAQQMQDFENDYPALVQLSSIGTTGDGDKELLFVKISDNVNVDEAEPKLMYTSTMHGDEAAGYPMMLTLIDYILTVYSDTGHADHARVKNLVENAELWINPNANPDGTYYNDPTNQSVAQARRANANGVDLNRNYPDNVAGLNPDGNPYQVETIAFMNFADQHNFVIAANFHGGTELVNYPFDNAYASMSPHPEDPGMNGPFYTHSDGDWYEFISVEYANNCQADAAAGTTSTPSYQNKLSYMIDDEDSYIYPSPGVTHGAEWYRVYGGRQDYMNVYQQTREVTIELSDTKLLQESLLDDYWYYNRDALLDYLTQGTYGYRGLVKDATNSSPIEGATITIVGHDAYGSEVSSDTNGDFYRPIKAGIYTLEISAPCYQTATISNQSISDFTVFDLGDIQLTRTADVPTNVAASNISTTAATITWDDMSSASYDIQYREVGTTPWNNNNTSATSFQLTGLTALTQYEVQVRSNCDSYTTNYSATVLFTTTDVIPCTGPVVSSFPYLETFDSGIGDWSQTTGDNGNWTLDANGTPTNNTGPSDDISQGGNYLYIEANGLATNSTVILESPCFDLTNVSSGTFSFYYHMFGSAMGSLDLEITTDNGDNWTTLFNISGNQSNVWNAQNINLNAYFGSVVKLRFIATRGTGNRSDIAIDNMSLGQPILNYCASNGNNTNDEYINRVQLNTLDNNNSGVGTTGTGYSDFTNNNALITDLNPGTQYTIIITPEWPGQTWPDGYAVYIDYNADGDFTDTDELVWSQAPSTQSPVSGNFTIPLGANFGETRMRVSLSYNAIPASCGSFGYGEVEDYTVNIAYDGLLFTNNTWIPNPPSTATGTENALILDGTFDANSDFAVNDLSIDSGATLNLDKANAITVNGNVSNDGEFILNSDSNEFSSLIVNGNVSGDVVYHRHANSNANGNDLLAPPVSGEIFTDFLSNNSNVFANGDQTLFLFGDFEKPTNDYMLFSNTESSTLDAGTGYRVASTDNGTFMFNGSVTTGTVNLPIERTGTNFAKWNLIGNPYPSYIRLADFLTANISELDSQSAAVYGYDADNSNGSVWTIWNLAYSDLNPNTLITPGQGFFVSSKSGGANISFTPSMRAAGDSDDFVDGMNASNTIEHAVIEIQSGTELASTDFYLTNNASLGLDLGYDAEHFGGAATDFSIFTHLAQENIGQDMAVQSIAFNDIDSSPIIPLGVYLGQGQQATIQLSDSSLNTDLYLEDVENNSFTLLSTSNYTFTADSNLNGVGRFFLRFEANALSTEEAALDYLQVYSNNNNQIVVKGQLLSKTTLYLYDTQGRLILQSNLNINRTTNTLSTQGLSTGVYLVTLASPEATSTKKVILR